jgi:hypothetical protein
LAHNDFRDDVEEFGRHGDHAFAVGFGGARICRPVSPAARDSATSAVITRRIGPRLKSDVLLCTKQIHTSVRWSDWLADLCLPTTDADEPTNWSACAGAR